jgi:hypothetical protein
MKRSKLFLGFTPCFLVVAAFAATKAKWHSFPGCYQTLNGRCIRDVNFVGSISGTVRLITVIPGVGTYLFFTCPNCIRPLYINRED